MFRVINPLRYKPTYAILTTASLFAISNYKTQKVLLDTQVDSINSISIDELKKHRSIDSGVWVSIGRKVYDLTNFLEKHPGGSKIILQYGGKDVTKLFENLHPDGVLENFLEPEQYIGDLVGDLAEFEDDKDRELEMKRLQMINSIPSISRMFSLSDFEYVAKQILPIRTWAYYSGGTDDNYTLRENHYAFQRIFFNPRVLNNSTEDLDMSTTMLGVKTSAPFYCSAAALAKLGHKDGELSIARGCGSEDIFQMISNASSYSFDDITDAAREHQSQWFQLYVKPDRSQSYEIIKNCEKKGIKAIFVTIDSSLTGSREKDYKLRFDVYDDENTDLNPMRNFKDSGLNWDDIINFKKFTNIPIVIKGVQRPDDVITAAKHNIDAVVLSNHGGRQLDFSRPPIEVLAEVMPQLRQQNLDKNIEIYIDGGVRRGTDIIKALCLGAKGVGLGRAFLYANSAYGEKGVKRAIQLLKSEIYIGMKLLGANKIEDLTPDLVDLRGLNTRGMHNDALYNINNDAIEPPAFK